MLCFLEYHGSVRHSISASLSLGLFGLLFVASAHAQINGVPSSVTSPGFGGHAINGTAPSVTSLGPRGYVSNAPVTFSANVPSAHHDHGGDHRHRGSRDGGYYLPYYYYGYPVPYAVDNSVNDDNSRDDAEYQGGPTIFDRRGQGEHSYVPPVKDVPTPHAGQAQDASLSDPAPASDPTLLVFKDGHQLEVGNYAIVGATLFDLTPGHPRRIALADLDLDATRKQNDDRGVVFQLPSTLQAN